MRAIEAENPDLKDVLPKTYNRFENSLLKKLLKTLNSVPMDIGGPIGTVAITDEDRHGRLRQAPH